MTQVKPLSFTSDFVEDIALKYDVVMADCQSGEIVYNARFDSLLSLMSCDLLKKYIDSYKRGISSGRRLALQVTIVSLKDSQLSLSFSDVY